MRVVVVGASGNLGSRVVRQAVERGWDVAAVVRDAQTAASKVDGRAELAEADLFAMVPEQLSGADALVSCFGSGFANPELNETACEKYLELGRACGVRVVAVTGSGCLYADASRAELVCEQEGYSKRLAPISRYSALGLRRLDEADDVDWRLVTPGLVFDPDGPLSDADRVRLDCSRVVCRDEEGESYSTYEDVARAMLDIAESGGYSRQLVSVLSPRVM